MKEIVLFYNFSEERMHKVRRALLPLKMCIKTVCKEDFLQPVGALVGMKDIALTDNKYAGDGFTDEMIVMSGFTSYRIDALIRALNKNGLGRVDLKAVITHTNREWNSIRLYNAIKADHEEMNKK